jgi:hypothetical protein
LARDAAPTLARVRVGIYSDGVVGFRGVSLGIAAANPVRL